MTVDEIEVRKMKRAWNDRADKRPFFYVETKHWDGDIEGFFSIGEERARLLIDPVLMACQLEGPDNKAIDHGCGLGRFTRALGKRFSLVIGVDISESMIRKAKDLNKDLNQEQGDVEFVVGDGISFPIRDRYANFIFSYEVFQHMPSHAVIEANLKDLARILSGEGRALVHFRIAFEYSALAYRLAAPIPTAIVALGKRVVGLDPLTSDLAWRGAKPLSKADIERLCCRVGLTVVEFRDDPTHATGSRIFAVLRLSENRL